MKRTKIVSTIGPKSESPEILKKLSEAGVNVFRLNFSHGTHDEHGSKIDNIRKLKLPGGIMLDTKGPEVRTGEVKNPFNVKIGDKFIFTTDVGVYEDTKKISVNYPEFIKDVKVGTKMTIDGNFNLEVKEIKGNDVFAEVIKGSGEMASKRHINFMSGEDVSQPTLGDKDWKDIDFGIEKKVDFIALSFCRTAKDIEDLRAYCAKKGHIPHIIPKIENAKGVENLEEIVQASDGIMVARGDLALEIPMARVPQVQKMIIELCDMYSKPVIIATQMVLSMVDNIRPTRAEVSDVANAVYQRADAIMTSEETTKSINPVNVIETMAEIAEVNEEEFVSNEDDGDISSEETINNELVKSAIRATEYVQGVDAIVVITKSGKMAMQISNEKSEYPVFAFTDNELACNTMALLWGVYPSVISFDSNDYEKTVQNALEVLKKNKDFKIRKYILISYYKANGKEYPLITVRDFK